MEQPKTKSFDARVNEAFEGKQMSGISFLRPDEAQSFLQTGSFPVTFRANESGAPIADFHYQEQKGKFKGINSIITDPNLWYLYIRNDICFRGVNRKADDATRSPFKARILDDKGAEQEGHSALKGIDQYLTDPKLQFRSKLNEALKSKRLFGLGMMILGLNDGQVLETPVTTADDLAYLRTFWRNDLDKIKGDLYIFNILEEVDGQIKETKLPIHKSRIVRVCGDNTLYGIGETTPLYNILEGLMNVDWAAFETYFQLASPILTLVWQGEIDTAKKDDIDELETQMQTVTATKRFIIPSKYEFKWVGPESDVPDPGKWWEWLFKRAASGYGVPQHILLGVEAGQKLGSENTLQQYYSDVANFQSPFVEDVIKAYLEKLRDLLLIPGWEGFKLDIIFDPLWEESGKEKWETLKFQAEALEIYVRSKVLTSIEAYVYARDGELPKRKDPSIPDLGEFTTAPEPNPLLEDNIMRANEQTRVPIPYGTINVKAVDVSGQWKPIVEEVHAGKMDPDQAKRMMETIVDTAADDMRLVAFHRLKQITGLDIVDLPPEAQASIDGEVAKLRSLAVTLIDDAAKQYEEPPEDVEPKDT